MRSWSRQTPPSEAASRTGAITCASPVETTWHGSSGWAASSSSPTVASTSPGSSSGPNTAGSWSIETCVTPSATSTSTGCRPARVSCVYVTLPSLRARATAAATPSDGCPANGISPAGIQIRLR